MGICFLCRPEREVPDTELGSHLLEMHNIDVSEAVTKWPDGEPVIVDHTLEPEDFERGSDG